MVAGVTVSVDDEQIRRALTRLQRRIGNLRPVMDEIGGRLAASTQQRFETEAGPDDQPWKPSRASFDRGGIGIHPRGGGHEDRGQTLTDTGRLRASITHSVGAAGDSVAVGTNVAYAGIHQFGGKTPPRTIRPTKRKALWWPGAVHPVKSVRHPGSKMPARPFLGLSSGDDRAIIAIIERRAREAARA